MSEIDKLDIHNIIFAYEFMARSIRKTAINMLCDIRNHLLNSGIDIEKGSEVIHSELISLFKCANITVFYDYEYDDGVYLFGDKFDRTELFNLINAGQDVRIYLKPQEKGMTQGER